MKDKRFHFKGIPMQCSAENTLLEGLQSWIWGLIFYQLFGLLGFFFLFMFHWVTFSYNLLSMILDQTALKEILNLCICNNAQEVISKKGLCILHVHCKTGHSKTLHNTIISNLYWHYLVSMKSFLTFLVLLYPLVWSYGTKKWMVWFWNNKVWPSLIN